MADGSVLLKKEFIRNLMETLFAIIVTVLFLSVASLINLQARPSFEDRDLASYLVHVVRSATMRS